MCLFLGLLYRHSVSIGVFFLGYSAAVFEVSAVITFNEKGMELFTWTERTTPDERMPFLLMKMCSQSVAMLLWYSGFESVLNSLLCDMDSERGDGTTNDWQLKGACTLRLSNVDWRGESELLKINVLLICWGSFKCCCFILSNLPWQEEVFKLKLLMRWEYFLKSVLRKIRCCSLGVTTAKYDFPCNAFTLYLIQRLSICSDLWCEWKHHLTWNWKIKKSSYFWVFTF